jgi:glycosyltransferase involved in cell wall biosynthesis
MDLSVVIPCYNEEESLAEMFRRVKAACDAVKINDYEIILVNDGSKDRTWPIMTELQKTDKTLVIVDLSRNYGHQIALTAGLAQAKGDYIFILDGDLQDPPELLGPMLEKARNGVDVVYGKRESRAGETKFKLWTSAAFYKLLSWLSDIPIPENTGDFRLIRRPVLEQLLAMPETHRFIRGMVAWIGFRQEPFLYKRDARYAGVTKYPFKKMLQFAFDAISSFSIKPLRISLLFALIGATIAAFLIIYILYSYFENRTVSGWASVSVLITFFACLQLLCIGVIGEYVGRIYIEVKHRPLFIVKNILRGQND